MSEPGAGAIFKQEAQDFGAFLTRLASDTLKNLALLAALSVIFFVAEKLKVLGMDAEHVKRIEDLHFWLTYALLLWIGFVFAAKIVRRGIHDLRGRV